ncbi:MAG: VIT and vWA domain-containing protein, partial [Rickettsiales bacterium]
MNKFYLILIVCCFAFSAGYASAATIDDLGGTVEAEVEGKRVLFPTLKTDVTADVQGDLATVTVKQVFQNPTHTPLNARYLFPLNKDAAVYAMTMEVGDEIVQAVIKKKEEAKKTFEKAKREGRAASLLTQHRPNMFTQNLANLMPGLPITVTLKYTQAIPKKDDYYELVVPLIVGPRYQPASAGVPPTIRDGDELVAMPDIRSDTAFGKWELEALPEYPYVAGLTIPDTIDKDRVSIRVNLNAAMPIQHIHSRTHEVKTEGEDKAQTVQLVQGRTIDNRDFVLCYQLAGENTAAGMLTAKNERGGYFSLMIEPPAMPDNAEITAREMVFVLDTSGSMSGEPISASKLFMKHAVQHLRPKDYFRIIRFSDSATEYTESPVPATPENVMNGLAYVNSLTANGGTNAMSSIDQAFLVPPHPGTLRIVVFLTDGYIGNESSILEEIHRKIGKARIYAFGIGTSVNRYLLSEMGRAGRGFARFIDPTEDTEDVAIELANKLESPVLTDIAIEWDGILAGHVTPAVIPDLFAGDSIRVQGRFEGSGEHTIKVHGR